MQKLMITLVLGWLGCIGTANAGLVFTDGNGWVTEIQGLDIGGTLYDVSFGNTLANATAWSAPEDALAASDAIAAALNGASPVPLRAAGGSNSYAVLFDPPNGTFNSYLAVNNGVNAGGTNEWVTIFQTIRTTSVFVAFTSVPLPPAVALLAVGLLGLAVSRRRTSA